MFGYGTNVPLQKNVPPMPKVRFDTYSDDKFETVCFEKEDEEYYLYDLGSKNYTFVNDKKIT